MPYNKKISNIKIHKPTIFKQYIKIRFKPAIFTKIQFKPTKQYIKIRFKPAIFMK